MDDATACCSPTAGPDHIRGYHVIRYDVIWYDIIRSVKLPRPLATLEKQPQTQAAVPSRPTHQCSRGCSCLGQQRCTCRST
jgi:hypothetical protein